MCEPLIVAMINEGDHMTSFIPCVSVEIHLEPKYFKLLLVMLINIFMCLHFTNSRPIGEGVLVPIWWIYSCFYFSFLQLGIHFLWFLGIICLQAKSSNQTKHKWTNSQTTFWTRTHKLFEGYCEKFCCNYPQHIWHFCAMLQLTTYQVPKLYC